MPSPSPSNRQVLQLGHVVRYPGVVGTVVTKLIRLGERGTVPEIINILS